MNLINKMKTKKDKNHEKRENQDDAENENKVSKKARKNSENVEEHGEANAKTIAGTEVSAEANDKKIKKINKKARKNSNSDHGSTTVKAAAEIEDSAVANDKKAEEPQTNKFDKKNRKNSNSEHADSAAKATEETVSSVESGKKSKEQRKKRKLSNSEHLDTTAEVTQGTEASAVVNDNIKEPKAKKFNKKARNNSNSEQMDTSEAAEQPEVKDQPIKSVDKSIFKYFKDLTNDKEQVRMEAAVQLIQHVNHNKDKDKRQKELLYTLKRFVRGCGASTNVSRSGFFIGLVGFLKAFNSEEISLQLLLDTLHKELNVGATIANKEDADAVVGKILVIGAILRSGRLEQANAEYLEQFTNVLLQSTHYRTYHASLGYSFMCEMLQALEQPQFESSVWPLLQKELVKPWPKQNLQTIYCLINVQKKFPSLVNAKFFKANFGGAELLNPESFQYLHKIFWEHSNTDILTHPAFECFGAYIATSKHLSKFWIESIEPGLANPTKLLEIETLKILTDILENLNVEQTKLPSLLSDNFMRMFIEGLKNLKQKKDETLKAFYADFLEALVKCCGRLSNDKDKVSVIKRLILPPGTFNIEKFCNNRIVHQLIYTLGEEGVKDIFLMYKSIFLGSLPKNRENASETWLNFERLNAGYMLQNLLQHKSVHTAYKWREEHLKFLFSCGVFYVTDAADICKKDAAGSFSKDFGNQCKNMFYACLQTKLTDIQEEQQLLYNLAQYVQEKIKQKHASKQIRSKFDESLQKSWSRMFNAVLEGQQKAASEKANKKSKGSQKLQDVFNILLLNMGLQLFREPEMAVPAIDDLLKCREKIRDQAKLQKKHKKGADNAADSEELEWIEVVVDLFLHLLSQNNGALRNIVNALFPHLCGNLSLSAVSQILAMLDMKDNANPLSGKNDDIEEVDEDEDEDEEEDKAESKKNGKKLNGKVKQDSDSDNDDESDEEEDDEEGEEEDEEDEEDDDDEEEEEEDEEEEDTEGVTASDKLRNAISQALIGSGSAAGMDDDMESVDLNDMTEEEGRRLDEALANAFKALRKTGGASQTKKSKSYRAKTTTVMHFRIRVLDLLELYLQHQPSLVIAIEIMLALLNMMEYCVGEELKPLQNKVEKTLLKLTSLKNYSNDKNEFSEDNVAEIMRLVVEKKAPAPVYDIMNRMRNKCWCFLIQNACKLNEEGATPKVLQLCQEYLQEFIKSRNPKANITLWSDTFKLRWSHNWQLAEELTRVGISMQVRTFRRIQIYEVLSELYKNHILQKQDEDLTKKYFKKIEKLLMQHLKELSDNETKKQSPKEFQTLLDLIVNVHKAHLRLQQQSALTAEDTLETIQNLRKQIRLESAQIYQRFCGTFGLKIIRNSDIQAGEKESVQSASDAESENEASKSKESEAPAGQKRKQNAQDSRKLKKLKKQQRLEAVSRGLNGGIGFSQNPSEAS